MASDVALLVQEAALRALRRGIDAAAARAGGASTAGADDAAAGLQRQLQSLSLAGSPGAAEGQAELCVTEADVRAALLGIHPSAMREARDGPLTARVSPPAQRGHLLLFAAFSFIVEPPSASRAQVAVEMPTTSWDDIGGMEDVKRELREVVDWCGGVPLAAALPALLWQSLAC